MTQSVLAQTLGLSFQQLQKYEKGVNRVPAARLALIARTLKLRPEELFGSQSEQSVTTVTKIIDKQSLRLIRAYSRISNIALRHQMVFFIEAVSKTYD